MLNLLKYGGNGLKDREIEATFKRDTVNWASVEQSEKKSDAHFQNVRV